MTFTFKAKIYKVGINACVDVPAEITGKMEPRAGHIKIKGKINGFDFGKNLVPVKDGPHRLFVNIPMLKGGQTGLGQYAEFEIRQNFESEKKTYPMPPQLKERLRSKGLEENFNKLTASRKKDILKYLNYIKTEATLERNIEKLITKMENREKDIRIP